MNKLMSAVLGLSLLVPAASFAQDTGGDKEKLAKKGAKVESKTRKSKGNKGTKGTGKGEKSKKGSSGSTTPPPK